jgi:hypothetical protein
MVGTLESHSRVSTVSGHGRRLDRGAQEGAVRQILCISLTERTNTTDYTYSPNAFYSFKSWPNSTLHCHTERPPSPRRLSATCRQVRVTAGKVLLFRWSMVSDLIDGHFSTVSGCSRIRCRTTAAKSRRSRKAGACHAGRAAHIRATAGKAPERARKHAGERADAVFERGGRGQRDETDDRRNETEARANRALGLEPSKTSGEKSSDDEGARNGEDEVSKGKRVEDREGESLEGLGRVSASGNAVTDQQERHSQSQADEDWVSRSNFEFDSDVGQRTVQNFRRCSDSGVGIPEQRQPLLKAEASLIREKVKAAQKTEADLVACQEKCRQLEEMIAAMQSENSTAKIELSRRLVLSERHVAEAQAKAEAAEAKIAVLEEKASLLARREQAEFVEKGVSETDTWKEERRRENKEVHVKEEEEARERRSGDEAALTEERDKIGNAGGEPFSEASSM